MKRLKFVLLAILTAVFVAALAGCGSKKAKYTFETNCDVQVAAVELKVGEEYELPVPTRDGYEFAGWYKSEDFSGTPVTSVVADKSATFYANWEKLYAITLDLDGGTLSAPALYLKAGAIVYDFMQSYTPTKTGYVFGAWFVGDKELSRNERMTENGISLTAKYKISYTVETYLESLDGSAYAKSEEVSTGYDYVGATVEPELKVTGFTETTHQDAVTSKVLTANASENVLKLYFNRDTYTLTFNANYPDGSTSANKSVTVKYGQEVEVLADYEFEGYNLAGWATSANGQVIYQANSIEGKLYNKTATTNVEPDKIKPERNMALYAIWDRGYTDMFNGDDYVFLNAGDDTVAYLVRGGVYFGGSYNSATSEFVFRDKNGDIILRGKIVNEGSYAYRNLNRDGFQYTMFVPGKGLDESVRIYFDAYNGLTYSVGSSTTTDSKGTYTFDEDGVYTAMFTEGEMSGQSLNFILGTYNGADAFQLRNETEFGLGEISGIRAVGDTVYIYYLKITLNGFGTATLTNQETSQKFKYTYSEANREIRILNMFGSVQYTFRLTDLNDTTYYAFYEKDYDITYTSASGATLKLDGTYNATYTEGDTVRKGTFEVRNDVLQMYGSSSKLVTFVSSDGADTYTYLVAKETITEYGEDGTESTRTVNSLRTVTESYAEYLFVDSTHVYYHPLLAINDTPGHASVYGYTTAGSYVLMSEGTYTYDAKTDRYHYVAANTYSVEDLANTTAYDVSDIKEMDFTLNVGATSYSVWYWNNYTKTDDTTETTGTTTYESADGDKITFILGFVLYETAGGNKVTGLYSVSDAGVYTFSFTGGTLYAEINEEDQSFFFYKSAPYTAYELLPDGSTASNQTLAFDGKGGATYTVKSGDESTVYVGTFAETEDTTLAGAIIYQFTETDGSFTFKFIQLSTSSARYFSRFNAEVNGEYRSTDGVLTLDGFGYTAEFLDANGNRTQGNYIIVEENLIRAVVGDIYRYFDLKGTSFTVRGTEYGLYFVMDNRYADGTIVELDGYGVATVRIPNDRELGDDNDGYDSYTGEYALIDGNYTLTYQVGAESILLTGVLGVYRSSTTTLPIFTITHSEVVGFYVNEKDWSTLILDGNGGAVRYNKDGVKETGSYLLITDSMLYYAGSSDACIYQYNKASGAATPKNFTPRTYYSASLEALVFTQYGFVNINGTTRSYYDVVDGNVFIYHKVEDGETPEGMSAYGFVVEEFGTFADQKTYDGKLYYANSGYAIEFSRVEETKNDYPVLVEIEDEDGKKDAKLPLGRLFFTPSGTATFRVNCTAEIGEKRYTGTITRTEEETYVQIGNYRFYVDLTYNGENADGSSNSSYAVTGMRLYETYASYNYYYVYYMFLMWYGSTAASSIPTNAFGLLEIVYNYGADGELLEEGGTYINYDCGQILEYYDLEGKIERFEELSYEHDEESNLYTATYESEDGYTYLLHFLKTNFTYRTYKYPCIISIGFNRIETFEVGDYTVTAERVVVSEYGYRAGSFFSVSLTESEEEIEFTAGYARSANTIYYVVRQTSTTGEGDDAVTTITGSTYYIINFTEDSVMGEEVLSLKPYESATVEKKTMTVYYAEDNASFIEVDDTNKIYLLMRGGIGAYLIDTCEYDSATKTYSVVTTGGTKFTVTRDADDTITITEVVEKEEGDEGEDEETGKEEGEEQA